ncbi:MAG: D-alanyl-D-alanine dipeptidase [Elainella sp. C42_A2020_010]|nr:D-alanyl-D-alanine dipeptidase [Elainella sp. C42_A2020_010]RNJ70641.1 MAG: D-alanyl-D-alanine dipeptidase [Leptolyngbya sp. IPPAS B-1204]
MKPYQSVPIWDCNEPLVEIPSDWFALELPHPYVKLGAPYGDKSPYFLRQGVLERLFMAQAWLQQQRPQWRIQIFDAYRPIAVQQFMVDYTFQQTLAEESLAAESLSEAQRQAIWQKVYQFWAVPSRDPLTPPPHSTGAAIDVTLVNQHGQVVDMGSPIDEMSPRSYPDYYQPNRQSSTAVDPALTQIDRVRFHQNRLLLRQAMMAGGFLQHPQEWWHFSYGDQLWAWLTSQNVGHAKPVSDSAQPIAYYGAI